MYPLNSARVIWSVDFITSKTTWYFWYTVYLEDQKGRSGLYQQRMSLSHCTHRLTHGLQLRVWGNLGLFAATVCCTAHTHTQKHASRISDWHWRELAHTLASTVHTHSVRYLLVTWCLVYAQQLDNTHTNKHIHSHAHLCNGYHCTRCVDRTALVLGHL